MKPITLCLFAFALFFIGCKKNNVILGGTKDVAYHYEYQDNTELIKNVDSISPDRNFEYYTIEHGKYRVFQYRIEYGLNNQVYDDEFVEDVTFQIPMNVDHFILKNDELKSANVIYKSNGAWGGVPVVMVTSGVIFGQKNDNDKWDITINIKVPERWEEEKGIYTDTLFVKI